MNMNVLDEVVKDAKNNDQPLSAYKGNVMLIVNVASKCGHTPQYAGLQALYEKYQGQGFTVLGFPCNQFGEQEPGSMEEILTFCSTQYDVSFPIFSKVDVNGDERSPLYAKLTQTPPEGDIGWNFEKFLVGRNGNVVARFSSRTKPDNAELVAAVEAALKPR
ncbi:MAG: glutathione peroxidase [Anaerolineae bacterium]|nr:glutathione peroxidase [Anaerolineae bacterium]